MGLDGGIAASASAPRVMTSHHQRRPWLDDNDELRSHKEAMERMRLASQKSAAAAQPRRR